MASNRATASTVMLLLAAVAAVSIAADAASLPKPSSKSWNMASVVPPKPSSKWSTPASASVARPKPSSKWWSPASIGRPKPSLMSLPPAASATCVTSLLDLSPCLSFFKDAGATAAPAGCCEGLRTIIDTQVQCLCHIVNHSLERAISVNIPIDRAFQLVGNICNLTLPPEVITSCGDKDRVPPLYACPAPSA